MPTIKELNLNELRDEASCKDLCNRIKHSSWVIPQSLAEFGSMTLKYSNGKIDCPATFRYNLGSEWLLGLWHMTRLPRSSIVANQVNSPLYGTFTPLILLGFKIYQDIPYGAWRDSIGLDKALEPRLYEIVSYPKLEQVLEYWEQLPIDDKLALRNTGLTYRTGPLEGTIKSAKSTWTLNRLNIPILDEAPKLLVTMLMQCWLAHSSVRHSNMLINMRDWDSLPEPIDNIEIFDQKIQNFETPW